MSNFEFSLSNRACSTSKAGSSSASLVHQNENFCTTQKITIQPTAIVKVLDCNNLQIPLRALLDAGSNANVITEKAASKLGLQMHESEMQLTMSDGRILKNVKDIRTTINSRYPKHANFTKEITCLVVPQLSSLPQRNINWKNFEDLSPCFLADPRFHISGNVDMIIGSDVTLRSFLSESQNLSNGAFLKETKFGWIVAGSLNDKYSSK